MCVCVCVCECVCVPAVRIKLSLRQADVRTAASHQPKIKVSSIEGTTRSTKIDTCNVAAVNFNWYIFKKYRHDNLRTL